MDIITIYYRNRYGTRQQRVFPMAEFDSALQWTLANVRAGEITFDNVGGNPVECEVFESTYAMHRATQHAA
jgi:hypothetical protein